jgi:hypothetical protein
MAGGASRFGEERSIISKLHGNDESLHPPSSCDLISPAICR